MVAPTTGALAPPIGSFQAISTGLIPDADSLSRCQPALDDDIPFPNLDSAGKPEQFASLDNFFDTAKETTINSSRWERRQKKRPAEQLSTDQA